MHVTLMKIFALLIREHRLQPVRLQNINETNNSFAGAQGRIGQGKRKSEQSKSAINIFLLDRGIVLKYEVLFQLCSVINKISELLPLVRKFLELCKFNQFLRRMQQLFLILSDI